MSSLNALCNVGTDWFNIFLGFIAAYQAGGTLPGFTNRPGRLILTVAWFENTSAM
jgi:hypothetical protein